MLAFIYQDCASNRQTRLIGEMNGNRGAILEYSLQKQRHVVPYEMTNTLECPYKSPFDHFLAVYQKPKGFLCCRFYPKASGLGTPN